MAKLTEKQLRNISTEDLLERYGYHRPASKSLPLKRQRKSFKKEADREEKELLKRGYTKASLRRLV